MMGTMFFGSSGTSSACQGFDPRSDTVLDELLARVGIGHVFVVGVVEERGRIFALRIRDADLQRFDDLDLVIGQRGAQYGGEFLREGILRQRGERGRGQQGRDQQQCKPASLHALRAPGRSDPDDRPGGGPAASGTCARPR